MTDDLEIIKQLEKQIGRELKLWSFDEIFLFDNPGFSINEKGQVTGLKLDLIRLTPTDLTTISTLHHLKLLSLYATEITDISSLQGLSQLKKLILNNNKIKKLPAAILQMGLDIDVDPDESDALLSEKSAIFIGGNLLEKPPIEIIKQGKEAIRTYFKSLEGKKQTLNEVKLLLVGDGGAGKTSLVKRLLKKGFDKNEDQTHGINIRHCKIKSSKINIRAHIWDFGGQEIMHATHQFFLSKRSLYILVLDGRKDEKTEYWLKLIQSFGGMSPVLVVLNKMDQNPAFDVNRLFLQEKYKNIKGFYRVSSTTWAWFCISKILNSRIPMSWNPGGSPKQFIKSSIPKNLPNPVVSCTWNNWITY